jgi:hypothetical protein
MGQFVPSGTPYPRFIPRCPVSYARTSAAIATADYRPGQSHSAVANAQRGAMAFLAFDLLLDSLLAARLLLLVNYRPEYQHRWASPSYDTQVRLDPLPPENAEELLDALLGHDADFDQLKREMIGRTEGNPFLLEECVRSLAETASLLQRARCLPAGAAAADHPGSGADRAGRPHRPAASREQGSLANRVSGREGRPVCAAPGNCRARRGSVARRARRL